MCGTSMSEPSALPSQLARSGKEGVSVKGRELMFCTCRSKTYAEERHRLAMQLETQGGRLPAKVRTSDTAHDDCFPTMCSSKIHPACEEHRIRPFQEQHKGTLLRLHQQP